GGIELGPILSHKPIELGTHALLGPSARLGGRPGNLAAATLLVRDGVVLVDIAPALREAGQVQGLPTGWIDCPSLRLTADERSVVRDANFELLLAWLQDYQVRRRDDGEVTWPASPFIDEGLPAPVRERAPGLRSASGRPITRDALAEEIHRGRELVYVWWHQARLVPAYARAKIYAPWPSELALLRRDFPEARMVPLQALGTQSNLDPEDLTSLRGGSHEPLLLARDAIVALPPTPGQADAKAPERVRIDIEAYVHRAQTATMGFISILAYERRVAQITDRPRVFSGLTLLCRVRPDADSPEVQLDVAALRRNQLAITAITDACRQRTLEHWEALISHVMSRARPWETPLLRSSLDQLGAVSLELGYRSTELGPRLGWRDTALLDVFIGKTVVGEEPRSLRDALRLLRDRGMIVVARDDRQFPGLRSDDPRLEPWQVPSWARPLLERVVGRMALLDMPAVPEAYPLVKDGDPCDAQRHLIRNRVDVSADAEKARTDPLARLRLLGQLLVVRGLGQPDNFALERLPLLERYDPRAMSTTRLVSLSAAAAEVPPPRLVPVGAVHRGLPRPVLEVTPGLAALLSTVAGFEIETGRHQPGATIIEEHDLRGDAPVRRRAQTLPPLLAKPVVHPLLVGRLHVAGDASSTGIAIWAGGLRQREITLPEPLGRVSGRLVKTPVGIAADPRIIDREVAVLAQNLLADALRQRALLPPIGPHRERLDLFIEYARSKIRDDDRFGLAQALGVAAPEDRGQRVAALRQMSLDAAPLRPLPDRREALLAQVVGQSLAMKVQFDTAVLTWRAANYRRRRPDGTFEVEFGLRNTWVQRGLDEDRALDPATHRRAALLAGVLVVAEFFYQAREADDVNVGPEHLVVALWRLLQLR
ncbi:MAG: hypothetical protein KC431_24645, partial [Myxococcales bacterium]|nr:hypothetical protein [Myxococcales bacterium]